jgi:hypothetical protein
MSENVTFGGPDLGLLACGLRGKLLCRKMGLLAGYFGTFGMRVAWKIAMSKNVTFGRLFWDFWHASCVEIAMSKNGTFGRPDLGLLACELRGNCYVEKWDFW